MQLNYCLINYGTLGFPGQTLNVRQSAWTTMGSPRFPAPSAQSVRPYRPPGPSASPRTGQGQMPRSPYMTPGGHQGSWCMLL